MFDLPCDGCAVYSDHVAEHRTAACRGRGSCTGALHRLGPLLDVSRRQAGPARAAAATQGCQTGNRGADRATGRGDLAACQADPCHATRKPCDDIRVRAGADPHLMCRRLRWGNSAGLGGQGDGREPGAGKSFAIESDDGFVRDQWDRHRCLLCGMCCSGMVNVMI